MTTPQPTAEQARNLDLSDAGLSIDMLDVDRLRCWARLIDIHGADITHWGQVSFVVQTLNRLADSVETAVRDIGRLREAAGASKPEEGRQS